MSSSTTHLKTKDHLLSRAERLIEESRKSGKADLINDTGAYHKRHSKKHRDAKMRQFYADLQLWVDSDD